MGRGRASGAGGLVARQNATYGDLKAQTFVAAGRISNAAETVIFDLTAGSMALELPPIGSVQNGRILTIHGLQAGGFNLLTIDQAPGDAAGTINGNLSQLTGISPGANIVLQRVGQLWAIISGGPFSAISGLPLQVGVSEVLQEVVPAPGLAFPILAAAPAAVPWLTGTSAPGVTFPGLITTAGGLFTIADLGPGLWKFRGNVSFIEPAGGVVIEAGVDIDAAGAIGLNGARGSITTGPPGAIQQVGFAGEFVLADTQTAALAFTASVPGVTITLLDVMFIADLVRTL